MEEQYAQVVKALEQELGDRVFLAVTDFHCDLETSIYPFSLTFASRISDTFFIFFFHYQLHAGRDRFPTTCLTASKGIL